MASLAPKILTALCTLCAAGSAWAQDMPTTPQGGLVDARRGLPLFPASSWKDGFFLEHTTVADLGFHARASAVYLRRPLGVDEPIDDRMLVYVAGVVSILKWLDFGVVFPFAIWQGGSGTNFTRQALGDLRVYGKIRAPLLGDKGLPVLGVSFGLGFPTGSVEGGLSAQAVSYFPKVIIDWTPPLFKKKLHIVGNLSGVISGTGQPCNPANLGVMDTLCPSALDSSAVAGLGNHFYYGFGGSLNFDKGLSVGTELLGSFAYAGNREAISPLLWTLGVRRAPANALTWGVMYGKGLTKGSPEHTVMVQFGYAFEVESPKDKDKPSVDINFKDGIPVIIQHQYVPMPQPGAPPPQPQPQPAGKSTAPAPSAAPQPQPQQPPPLPPPTTLKMAPSKEKVNVEVPDDWWPKEEKK